MKRYNERITKMKTLLKQDKVNIEYDSDEDFSEKNFEIHDRCDIL